LPKKQVGFGRNYRKSTGEEFHPAIYRAGQRATLGLQRNPSPVLSMMYESSGLRFMPQGRPFSIIRGFCHALHESHLAGIFAFGADDVPAVAVSSAAELAAADGQLCVLRVVGLPFLSVDAGFQPG
jgi:hypothetical protein